MLLGTDLFHYIGKDYLLAINYFSNYPKMAVLNSTTTNAVILYMKSNSLDTTYLKLYCETMNLNMQAWSSVILSMFQ